MLQGDTGFKRLFSSMVSANLIKIYMTICITCAGNTEFTCILERCGKMSGATICYVFFSFLFSTCRPKIVADPKDSYDF